MKLVMHRLDKCSPIKTLLLFSYGSLIKGVMYFVKNLFLLVLLMMRPLILL